jgi:hypothetical protein
MKSKIKLTTDNLTTYFALIPCECGSKNHFDDLDIHQVGECKECERPLIYRANDGYWYYIGAKVFE